LRKSVLILPRPRVNLRPFHHDLLSLKELPTDSKKS
jgi:hypothetical protein